MNYESGERYIVGADGVFVKQKSRSNRGLCIEGVATKYNTILYYDSDARDRFLDIQPGAFDIGLKYEPPPQFWIEHNPSLAMPGCKVEFHSTETELNFRVTLDESELAIHSRDLVKCGAMNQVSIGWHSSKTITKNIGGKDVVFILAGIITELSLVKDAAIKTTHAQVSMLKDCRSLRDDVESKKFRSDNSYAELRRKLTALEEQ